MQTPQPKPDFDWRTIVALNAVSTLSQVGQFGIIYVVLPVWLVDQGLDAAQVGLFAASLWLGQLPGLALAPWLCRVLGAKPVVLGGLLATLLALVWMALGAWPHILLGGVLAGLGLGLRWIGLEPWLYSIAPAHARGRLVGFHETLIGLAPIIAPALAGWFGVPGHAVFWIGAGFTLAAVIPLLVARSSARSASPTIPATRPGQPQRRDLIFRQGVIIALLGGMAEAAFAGLFGPFAQAHGYTVGQITAALTAFGVGGLLLQYAVGWLADHRGLTTAAVCCAIGTLLCAAVMALPLGYAGLIVTVFLLGGFVTSFLTLALIASTTTKTGTMAGNVSQLSMLYSASAVVGPLLAGAAMRVTQANALAWFLGLSALLMAALLGRRDGAYT